MPASDAQPTITVALVTMTRASQPILSTIARTLRRPRS
jgi:hypothetical protein